MKKKKAKKINWKKKCDDLWGDIIHRPKVCAVCGSINNTQAHHLIGKTGGMTKYRHAIWNGILLCCSHHNFNLSISGHASTAAAHELFRWLERNRLVQYRQCMKAKDDKSFMKMDYEEVYKGLLVEWEAVNKGSS